MGPYIIEKTTYRHLSANINGLLRMKTAELGRIFEMPGSKVREELKKLKAKGDRLIPSEGCDNFCPQTGCKGHERKEESLPSSGVNTNTKQWTQSE